MKKFLLLGISVLLAACSTNYSTKTLSPSCQDYFQVIDNNLSKSSLSNLSDVKISFNESKQKLDALPVEKQNRICNIRMAHTIQKSK
ncbi:hypothetical protein EV697_10124 [Bisgaardia hudsonensis]|uniref:Lipoprotein n=1 Tax=Bisgaardia hudsonensis TaxID=109472 RepID=A0A4R2N246_9PAST|nr:DUF5339 family protein [Bisgaardia hudsonensis]QLB12382.1 hypothetical protein A6A11_01535 [Bisgaardia hudsonensis]TCP13908.1 hypothetical protein EV697_10124 [Bisgaardia hudsonensis]